MRLRTVRAPIHATTVPGAMLLDRLESGVDRPAVHARLLCLLDEPTGPPTRDRFRSCSCSVVGGVDVKSVENAKNLL